MINGIVFVRQDGIDKALIPYNDREEYVIKTHLDHKHTEICRRTCIHQLMKCIHACEHSPYACRQKCFFSIRG